MRPEAMTRRGRRRALRLMIATGIVHRPGPEMTDPDTGVVTPGLVEVYAGKCKLQGARALASEPVAGGQKLVIENLQIHFPTGSGLQIDDVCTLTASAMDPDLVGLKFRLTEKDRGELRTAARWNVELVVK